MFGTKAPLLVDLFMAGLLGVLVAMLIAVRAVRRGQTKRHARIMGASYAFFLISVLAFEVQVNLLGTGVPLAMLPLGIHLLFAIPCTVVWTWQIATARRALTEPGAHRTRGKVLFVLLSATLATGFWLYVATFV